MAEIDPARPLTTCPAQRVPVGLEGAGWCVEAKSMVNHRARGEQGVTGAAGGLGALGDDSGSP